MGRADGKGGHRETIIPIAAYALPCMRSRIQRGRYATGQRTRRICGRPEGLGRSSRHEQDHKQVYT